jgi:hypothetical protein
MHSEDIYSVLNCHNVAKYTEVLPEIAMLQSGYQFPEMYMALTFVDFERSSPEAIPLTHYRKEPLRRPTINSWPKNFVEAGCYGRPRVSDAAVEQLRESFVRSPRKTTRRASQEISNHIEIYLSQAKLGVFCYI